MTATTITSKAWRLALALLGVLVLLAAPAMQARAAGVDVAATAMDCAGAPCPGDCDHHPSKSVCVDACALACHVLTAPEVRVAEPLRLVTPAVLLSTTKLRPGLQVRPELPPPR